MSLIFLLWAVRLMTYPFQTMGGGTFNYTPNPDAFKVDPAVTHIRINPKGVFKGNTEAAFRFRVRIK